MSLDELDIAFRAQPVLEVLDRLGIPYKHPHCYDVVGSIVVCLREWSPIPREFVFIEPEQCAHGIVSVFGFVPEEDVGKPFGQQRKQDAVLR